MFSLSTSFSVCQQWSVLYNNTYKTRPSLVQCNLACYGACNMRLLVMHIAVNTCNIHLLEAAQITTAKHCLQQFAMSTSPPYLHACVLFTDCIMAFTCLLGYDVHANCVCRFKHLRAPRKTADRLSTGRARSTSMLY